MIETVLRYETRGGKHAIVMQNDGDGTYSLREYTNGEQTSSSVGHTTKEEAQEKLDKVIQVYADIDNILFKRTK